MLDKTNKINTTKYVREVDYVFAGAAGGLTSYSESSLSSSVFVLLKRTKTEFCVRRGFY